MLELRTLGSIDLREADGRRFDSVLLHAKRVLLLAHLCASYPPRLHRRATLLALFWPDLDEVHARGALRHELYELRRALGTGVLVGDGADAIGVDPGRIRCDVVAFEAALDAGQLEDALKLYGGEFLAGLEVGAGELERSLENARARLMRRAASAARLLAARAEERGDLDAAVSWSWRETELAECDESGWQRLILLLDRIGDRAGALKAFDSLTTTLRDALEIEPSPETTALVEQIRHRSEAFDTTSRAGVTQGSSATPLFTPPALVQTATEDVATGMPGRSSHNGQQTRTVIQLLPVDNQSGDRAFDDVGRRVDERLAQALVETPFLKLVSGENGDAVAAALSATVFRRGDRIEVRTSLAERGNGGRILEISPPVPITREARDDSLNTIAAHALAAVATHYDPRAIGTGDRTVPFRMRSWEAYLEYLEGTELYGNRRFADAAGRLLNAYAMDSTFVKAALFGALALWYAGQSERAESVITEATAARALTDYERNFAAWVLSDIRGRRGEAYRAAKELARVTHHPVFVGAAAWQALWICRPRESVRATELLNHLGHGWWRNWTYAWENSASALHVVNDHHGELALIREGRARFPEAVDLIRAEVRAHAALGDAAQVLGLVAEALTKPPAQALRFPFGQVTPADVGWTAAQEFEIHGHAGTAERARALAIQWSIDRDDATLADKVLLSRLYLESGDLTSASRILSALPPTDDPEYLGAMGLVCAANGDEAGVRDAVARLEGLRSPYLVGRHLLHAAGVRAALDEGAVAVKALQRAFAAGLPYYVDLHALPMLRPLADREDFREVLRPRG